MNRENPLKVASNRSLLCVRGSTVYSLDDDHRRLSSSAIENLTGFRSLNNPKKALGPVGNAACSALLSTFVGGHHS